MSIPDPTQPIYGAPVPPPYTPAPVPPKKAGFLKNRAFITVVSLVVGLVFGTAMAGGSKSASNTVAGPQATVTVIAAPEDADDPAAEPTEEPTVEPTEEATTEAPAPEPKASYKTLSTRQFKRLVKDPDSYVGKTYIIYGEITQFDAATGTDTFRADTGAKKLRISYGFVNYPENSMLTGDEKKLKKLVEGDCFKAHVTVSGSFSYDTQAGGNTTVPEFQVDSISVYGSTD